MKNCTWFHRIFEHSHFVKCMSNKDNPVREKHFFIDVSCVSYSFIWVLLDPLTVSWSSVFWLKICRFFDFDLCCGFWSKIWSGKNSSISKIQSNTQITGSRGHVGVLDELARCLGWSQTPHLPKITSWLKSYRPILISTRGGQLEVLLQVDEEGDFLVEFLPK